MGSWCACVCVSVLFSVVVPVFVAGVTWLKDGAAWCSVHHAMPFGAVGSVWAWHRIGALIASVARKLLRLPVLRYVDDYFSIDAPGAVVHAMQCFARLVPLLLGSSAIAERNWSVARRLGFWV